MVHEQRCRSREAALVVTGEATPFRPSPIPPLPKRNRWYCGARPRRAAGLTAPPPARFAKQEPVAQPV